VPPAPRPPGRPCTSTTLACLPSVAPWLPWPPKPPESESLAAHGHIPPPCLRTSRLNPSPTGLVAGLPPRRRPLDGVPLPGVPNPRGAADGREGRPRLPHDHPPRPGRFRTAPQAIPCTCQTSKWSLVPSFFLNIRRSGHTCKSSSSQTQRNPPFPSHPPFVALCSTWIRHPVRPGTPQRSPWAIPGGRAPAAWGAAGRPPHRASTPPSSSTPPTPSSRRAV